MPNYKRKSYQRYHQRKLFGMTQTTLPASWGGASRLEARAPAPSRRGRTIPVVAPPRTTPWTRTIGTQTKKTGSRKVVSRANASTQTGGYLQWEEQRANVKIGRNSTLLSQLALKMKQAETKVLYKFQGVKAFDDNGYYWLQNIENGYGRRYLPFYALDLTSCVNVQSGSNIVQSTPLCTAYMETSTGNINFDQQSGVLPFVNSGSNLSPYWTMEQSSGSGVNTVLSSSITTDTIQLPHSKDILKWASINFNLWGAKAKSTKYVAQIVQFKDDALLPYHGTAVSSRRTSFYQSMLKQYVFNPISTSGVSEFKKYIKVIKSETFNIGPTRSSTRS